MRIGWIADYFISQHLGGAQQTNDRIIKYGEKHGYEILEITPNNISEAWSTDLLILNNITMFDIEEIKSLIKKIPAIRYEHDEWCSQMHPEIYRKTLLNIFLSPLHFQRCSVNAKRVLKGICIPSPIDTKIFNKIDVKKKKDTVIWGGSFAPHKGFDELLLYAKNHPEKEISIVSFDFDGRDLPENIKFIGERHGEELAQVYKEAEIFFHHPVLEPFGRMVMEAYLCDCQLDVNKNIGALSYNWDYNDYDTVKRNLQSERIFWEEVFKVYEKFKNVGS